MDFEIIRAEPDSFYDRVYQFAVGGPVSKGAPVVGVAYGSSRRGASPIVVTYDKVTDFKSKLKTLFGGEDA